MLLVFSGGQHLCFAGKYVIISATSPPKYNRNHLQVTHVTLTLVCLAEKDRVMLNSYKRLQARFVAGILLAGLSFSTAMAQQKQTSSASTAPAVKPASVNPYSRHSSMPKRAKLFYGLDWGVSSVSAKSVESGELIRFSYHVVDANKAAPLNDGKFEPYLVDERSHVKLVIPSLEKVGQLRNKNTPENGKSYWMAFSNKGGYVKKGDVVTVVIGKFRAAGLIVQ